MQRLLWLFRGSSDPIATAAIVGSNLVPLAGVAWFGWNLWTILALYWVENGVIGVITVLRILLAEGGLFGVVGRVGTAAFFAMHYGIFWFVHGIFVLVALPTFGTVGIDVDAPAVGADAGVVAFGAAWLAVGHAVTFVLDYVRRGEYRTTTPAREAGAPYARLVVLHLAILFGAFVAMFLGTPIGILLVLVLLKLGLELAVHARERQSAAGRLATMAA